MRKPSYLSCVPFGGARVIRSACMASKRRLRGLRLGYGRRCKRFKHSPSSIGISQCQVRLRQRFWSPKKRSRGSSNGEGMSLNQIVGLLIDESISRYIRAISLFEFQTAIFRPKSFERLIEAQVGLRAPTQILRTARTFAAIKILEKIESDLKDNKKVPVISIQDLAADETYRSIFDDVIAANGGWSRIRHSPSARSFDRRNHLKGKEKTEPQAAANVVDYSYRFSK